MKRDMKALCALLIPLAIFLTFACGSKDNPTIEPPILETVKAPSDLEVLDISYDNITLSWKNNSDKAHGVEIERSDATGSDFVRTGYTKDPNVTTYTDRPLDPATAYTYRIRAYNSFGVSRYTEPIFVETLKLIPPPTYTKKEFSVARVELEFKMAKAAKLNISDGKMSFTHEIANPADFDLPFDSTVKIDKLNGDQWNPVKEENWDIEWNDNNESNEFDMGLDVAEGEFSRIGRASSQAPANGSITLDKTNNEIDFGYGGFNGVGTFKVTFEYWHYKPLVVAAPPDATELGIAKIQIELNIDGTDILKVTDNNMHVMHITGTYPLDNAKIKVWEFIDDNWNLVLDDDNYQDSFFRWYLPPWDPDTFTSSTLDINQYLSGDLIPGEFTRAVDLSTNIGDDSDVNFDATSNDIIFMSNDLISREVYKITFKYYYTKSAD